MTEPIALLPPVVGLAACVGLQIVFYRARSGLDGLDRLFSSIATGYAFGAIVMSLAHGLWVWRGQAPVADAALLAANLVAYTGFAYTYLHFLSMGETARRVRILIELTEAGAAGLSEDAIQERYSDREVVDRRLERLSAKRQIEERNGRLFIRNGEVLWIAGCIVSLRRLLGFSDAD